MGSPETTITLDDLSSAQRELADRILKYLETRPPPQQIHVVHGLSGVGKTRIVDALRDRVAESLLKITEPWKFPDSHKKPASDSEEEFLQGHHGHLLTTATRRELKRFSNGHLQKDSRFEVTIHHLKGLTEDEIRKFVDEEFGNIPRKLSHEQIIELSMGIPLLARQLMLDPELTYELAARVCARYLVDQFENIRPDKIQDVINQYIQLLIPDAVLALIPEMEHWFSEKNDLYDELQHVLARRLQSKDAESEESPLFLAEGCREIYTDMIRRRDTRPEVNIYIPDMSAKNLQRIQKSLYLTSWGREREGPRMKMFGATVRKAGYWLVDENGREHEFNAEGFHTKQDWAEGFEERFKQKDYPLQARWKKKRIRLCIHKHEHDEIRDEPARFGWMIETLLQHLGLEYVVSHTGDDKVYVYHPKAQKIELLNLKPDHISHWGRKR